MMRYLSNAPKRLPRNGRVLVHNRVHAATIDQENGVDGFRFWTDSPDVLSKPSIKKCSCGWSELPHYRSHPDDAFGRYPEPVPVAATAAPTE